MDAEVNHFLYQTSLIRKIMDTSRDYSQMAGDSTKGGFHTFSGTSGNRIPRGFLVFIRKIANKLVEMQKANEEISSFLESIPEWGEYYENELCKQNEVESKPLGQDPRNKQQKDPYEDVNEDDIFVKNFLNRYNRQQEEKKNKDFNFSGNDDEDEEDEGDLKHTGGFSKGGHTEIDEDLLEVGNYEENEEDQVKDR